MNIVEWAPLVALALLLATVLLVGVGHSIGRRRMAMDASAQPSSFGAIEGSVFGLMGLLLAFSFSGAHSRFETRRQLILQEANALGTAWLRLDLLPSAERGKVQAAFRTYLDARITAYRLLPDLDAAQAALGVASGLGLDLWKVAVSAVQASGGTLNPMSVLPPVNECLDLASARTSATQDHPPAVIFLMLATLILVGAFVAGHSMATSRKTAWLHAWVFAGALAATGYVILDLEYPRMGFIRVDKHDALLVDLRATMAP